MTMNFRRCTIGGSLFDELRESIGRGDSAVLLAPRYGGKRHVLRKLAASLGLPQPGGLFVRAIVAFPSNSGVELTPGETSGANALISYVDRYYEASKKPFVLLVAGIEEMPHDEARTFLAQVRVRVSDRRLVAVLAGETNLRELVHGPNSEFNCATQYILQGLDVKEFSGCLKEYETSLRLRWLSRESALRCLHEKTGGSAYLLRLLISVVLDWRADKTLKPTDKIDAAKLYTYEFRRKTLPDNYWSHVLRHATNAIASDAKSWGVLEKLLDGDERGIKEDLWEPHTLELAGLAVYDSQNQLLRFCSPLIKDFAAYHYSARTLADLYAINGDWQEAFARYRTITERDRCRPLGVDDLHEVEALARALGSGFRRAALEGVVPLERLFQDGCQLLLGFPEVFYWVRENQGEWRLDTGGYELSEEATRRCLELLSTDVLDPEPNSRNRAIAALPFRLSTEHESRERAVVVGNLISGAPLSLQRRRLLQQLGDDFGKAHEHAVSVENNRRRLRVRNTQIEIITQVFSGLGSKLLNPLSVLNICAKGLRELGYKRVMFSVVNPERTRIVGALDEPGTPGNLIAFTDYPLSAPDADVQPWVVDAKVPRIIRDARMDPLCNSKAVDGAGLVSLAIVPMLDHNGDVSGTIHIERTDGLIPDKDEVEVLMLFGRELSGILAQSRRMTMIYEALNKVPEPLLISDMALQLKFANQPACKLFPALTAGWQDPPFEVAADQSLSQITGWFKEALKSGRSSLKKQGIGNSAQYFGEVLVAKIDGIGALVHISDQTFLMEIFAAIQSISKATTPSELVECLFTAADKLGFPKRRYYKKPRGEDRLVSARSVGHELDAERRFERGEIKIDRSIESAFECLDSGQAEIFIWRPYGVDSLLVERNDWGLNARIVKQEAFNDILGKRDGDVRVDLPLKAGDKIIGKISVERKDPVKPEEFTLLRILVTQVQAVLQSIEQRDLVGRLEGVELATRRAFAMASHQFRNELTPIDTVLARYRVAGERNSTVETAISALNDHLAGDINLLHDIVNRMPELLGSVIVKPEKFGLADLIRERAGKHRIRHVHLELATGVDSEINADRHHLSTVISELFDNTVEMRDPNRPPAVSMRIEELRQGHLEISYRDNGPGIPDFIREAKIFDMGYSYRPGQHPGSGIGLNYVRRVLEAHGGGIRAVACDSGAEFVLNLPRDYGK
jgi:signal transduction histidine kinase